MIQLISNQKKMKVICPKCGEKLLVESIDKILLNNKNIIIIYPKISESQKNLFIPH